eukprot:8019098-Alexandrium_andersonii.AAC.1
MQQTVQLVRSARMPASQPAGNQPSARDACRNASGELPFQIQVCVASLACDFVLLDPPSHSLQARTMVPKQACVRGKQHVVASDLPIHIALGARISKEEVRGALIQLPRNAPPERTHQRAIDHHVQLRQDRRRGHCEHTIVHDCMVICGYRWREARRQRVPEALVQPAAIAEQVRREEAMQEEIQLVAFAALGRLECLAFLYSHETAFH